MPEPDILGGPFTVETLVLAHDREGAVEANLVTRRAEAPTRRAVLHTHGFCDYFFHTEYAAWWAQRGYDFHALDLRKHGRSLRDHQSPSYVEDLAEYYEELDAAWELITRRDGCDEIVISAHSTGGLIMALWASDRAIPAVGMVLNSPWLDMHGPFWVRLGSNVVRQLGSYQPRREIPRSTSTVYGRTLHHDFDGEWDYDLTWKPLGGWPVYAGWLRAVRRGHARLHRGLGLPFRVLVLTSGGTARSAEVTEEAHTHDLVLDVRQMRRWAPALSSGVTIVSVEGARHDVVLSRPAARERVYEELERWTGAYLPADDTTASEV